jgi:glucose-6-phosphate 1-dehydrogenase
MASHSDLTRKFIHTVRVVSSQESYSKLAAKFVASAVNLQKVTVVAIASLPYSVFYRDAIGANLRGAGAAPHEIRLILPVPRGRPIETLQSINVSKRM